MAFKVNKSTMMVLEACLSVLWPRWNSVWDVFNALTCSTWYLSLKSLAQWVNSDQQSALKPEPRHQHRLFLLQLWMGLNVVRYALYLALLPYFPAVVAGNHIVMPRFPYYFGDVLQLLNQFAFYGYTAVTGALLYGFIISYQLQLDGYVNVRYLRWYRTYVYIEAMLKLNCYKAKAYMLLLRPISPFQYNRYRRKFQRALRVQCIVLRLNNFIILLNFYSVMIKIFYHPEWDYPLIPSFFFSLIYQLCYYFMFKISFCMQIVFYMNSTFMMMMFDSILDYIKLTQSSRQTIRLTRHFSDAFHLLTDLNCFWSHKLGNYYILLLPTVMPCIYLLFFVHIHLAYSLKVLFVVLLYTSSMHHLNWTAANVHVASQIIYKQLYHRGIIIQDNLSTQFKLSNMLDILTSKSIPFGFSLGTMGTARRRSSIIIFILMIRFLLYATKVARTMQ